MKMHTAYIYNYSILYQIKRNFTLLLFWFQKKKKIVDYMVTLFGGIASFQCRRIKWYNSCPNLFFSFISIERRRIKKTKLQRLTQLLRILRINNFSCDTFARQFLQMTFYSQPLNCYQNNKEEIIMKNTYFTFTLI